MKTKLLIIFLIFIPLISCSNQEISFHKNSNFNKILNNFKKGKFYSCYYDRSFSTGLESENIPEGFTSTPDQFMKKYAYSSYGKRINKKLTIVSSNERIGVIFEKPIQRWSNRTSMIYKKEKGNTYIWKETVDLGGKFLVREGFPNDFPLKFDGQMLSINEERTYFTNFYYCSEEKYGELLKEKIVRYFLKPYGYKY